MHTTTETDGEPYVIEAAFDAPADIVWAALTRKSLVDRYYFVPLIADITRTGDEVSFGTPEHTLITGVVLDIENQKLLRHSFRFTDEADKTETFVTYVVAADAKGTRLRIEQRGYARGSQGYADIAGGWPIIVERMRSVVADASARR